MTIGISRFILPLGLVGNPLPTLDLGKNEFIMLMLECCSGWLHQGPVVFLDILKES